MNAKVKRNLKYEIVMTRRDGKMPKKNGSGSQFVDINISIEMTSVFCCNASWNLLHPLQSSYKHFQSYEQRFCVFPGTEKWILHFCYLYIVRSFNLCAQWNSLRSLFAWCIRYEALFMRSTFTVLLISEQRAKWEQIQNKGVCRYYYPHRRSCCFVYCVVCSNK